MQKQPITKYRPFIPTKKPEQREWPDKYIQTAPVWCSVDLRDGNQALAIPMTVGEKSELFQTLVAIGFKEIEIGFPSASDTEYAFCRHLIEKKLIPDDVCIQVLVQARDHLVKRTFEAIKGAPQAIIHLYNSTNPVQRRFTFNMSKEAIKNLAVEGVMLVKQLAKNVKDTHIRFQYSPESFSETETEYALEICEAVIDIWQPSEKDKIILNLPATVERATPNIHADQIEWFCKNLTERKKVFISLHTHNDRGTGIAATELGLMAGADRVEGTLFGNGERTGNLDIITAALNLYTQGIDPQLDLSKINTIRKIYERTTRMKVHERHPYAGDLVFTAFSGSHQDAIKKADAQRNKDAGALYTVPYLPIDPEDIGRSYKAIIRINSQSGKGGIAYILEQEYGLELPKKMQAEFSTTINKTADEQGKELRPEEIYNIFKTEYLNLEKPLKLENCKVHFPEEGSDNNVICTSSISYKGKKQELKGQGNGPIAAFVKALEEAGLKHFHFLDYREHAMSLGSSADAISYIALERDADKKVFWGVGIDSNIEKACLKALVSAYNRTSF